MNPDGSLNPADALREIAAAVRLLAAAQQAEADATATLIDLRKAEVAAAIDATAARAESDRLARESLKGYQQQLTELGPALELLITIGKALRGNR